MKNEVAMCKGTTGSISAVMVLIGLLLCSCGSGLKGNKSKTRHFDSHSSGTFDNQPFKTNGRRYGSPSLLELFEIHNVSADSVSLRFSAEGLQLVYTDGQRVDSVSFQGKFSKKGYYELFLSNEKVQIPPFFPFIYGRHNINRIRTALTIEGDLIIDNMWNQSGNIFILGVGDKGRRQSYFKQKL